MITRPIDASIGTMDTSPEAAPADDGIVEAGAMDAGADGADGADGTTGPTLVPTSAWEQGQVMDPLPARSTLKPLPGGGEGSPVVVSNNPESFEGPGLLYGTREASATRGGTPLALEGSFGAYVHHFNKSPTIQYVTLLVVNAHVSDVTVEARGSGYTQDETGGLDLGSSPDYRVSEDWIRNQPNTLVAPTVVPTRGAAVIFQRLVGINREVDGRFGIRASGPVHVLVVSSTVGTLEGVLAAAATGAPGYIAVSGTPPPPYGREAGVYSYDTWRATMDVPVPTLGRRIGFMVNTATGTGLSQVQAFPSLTNYNDSARESVGMYGNVYDITLRLSHDGTDTVTRRVRVSFASYVSSTALSRYWDGAALVDGTVTTLRNTPGERIDVLREVMIAPGAMRTVTFRAMVPGLVSIPQALFLESY